MKTSFDITLEELEKKPDFLKYLPFAISALKACGVIDALRALGRPDTIPATQENCVPAQAFEAQKSIGYNNAIDDLIYFKERYLKNREQTNTPALNYGASTAAIEAGDLTKEELDAVIAGTDPNSIYDQLYRERTIDPSAAAGTESGTKPA